MELGTRIENSTKRMRLKIKVLTKGVKKKRKQASLMTSSKPNLLHSLIANSIAMSMTGTESIRIIEFVYGVIFVPW